MVTAGRVPDVADPEDHRLARDLAEAAGRRLVELRHELTAGGTEPSEIRDQGDLRSHRFLMERLQAERPDDAVLSEEAKEDDRLDRARLSASRVWIIDPLDGTREYGEGRDDWAVHVALVEAGVPTAGAVALPALAMVLGTDDPPRVPPAPERIRVVVSRSRPPAEALAIAAALDADLVEMGSAGAKAMAVVRGLADVYPHSGGQYEWDSCAPVAVAAAAGLHCSRLDGTPLVYNRADPYLPDLLVCRAEHASGAIAGARAPGASDRGVD